METQVQEAVAAVVQTPPTVATLPDQIKVKPAGQPAIPAPETPAQIQVSVKDLAVLYQALSSKIQGPKPEEKPLLTARKAARDIPKLIQKITDQMSRTLVVSGQNDERDGITNNPSSIIK